VYCWNGFGFDLLTETVLAGIPEKVSTTHALPEGIILKYHTREMHYFLSDNKLTPRGR
jgi:hypothetical protein